MPSATTPSSSMANYTAGVTLGNAALLNIRTVSMAAGNNYNLTLGGGDSALTMDGSARWARATA